MFKHKEYFLSDIIKYVIETDFKDDDFCIYGNNDIPLNLQDKYFVSNYPDVYNDKEIFPLEVQTRKLGIVYDGQQFVDVISEAREQKSSVSETELLEALNYYYDNDDFITFS